VAHEALKKALTINPDLADAHGALADYYLVYEWDWQAAKNEFDTALRLDPNSSELHESYGMYLEALGRYDEAVSERETARKLDPMSPAVTADVGYPLYYARRQDEAIAYFRKGLELDPNYSWAHAWIGQSYLELKKYPEAIAEIDKAVDLSQGASRIIATRGFAFAVAGRRDDALKVLADLDGLAKEKYVSPYFFAVIYAGLGEKDKAFHYLDEAVAERHPYLVLANVEPVFDDIRSDPRFPAILDKVNLPR
jgi:tetratricopeptide (TPR) repeat protein